MIRRRGPSAALCLLAGVLAPACGGTHDATTTTGGTPDAGLNSQCLEQCVPVPPAGWSQPWLVWFGEDGNQPACPDTAPLGGYDGHTELSADPIDCPACACAPAEVACKVPDAWTISSQTCAMGAGDFVTPLGVPNGWDGACDTSSAIPAKADCGTGPCVQSLSVGPASATASPCAVVASEIPAAPPPDLGDAVYVCVGNLNGQYCDSETEVCTARGDEAGFATCIWIKGDVTCPSEWPNKHAAYEDVDDTRSCAACVCGDPTGGDCTVTASVFANDTCSPSAAGSGVVGTQTPLCVDLPSGSAIGSKSATIASVTPGICAASGGEPTGSVEKLYPATFCCMAEAVP